jgi:hypothetical protein
MSNLLTFLLSESKQQQEREQRKEASITAYEKLPQAFLQKLAGCHDDTSWLAQFQNTPLMQQALGLMDQLLVLEQQQQQENRLRQSQWQMGDQLSNQISDVRMQQKMLEVELYKLQAGQAPTDQPTPVAPPAQAGAPEPAAPMAVPPGMDAPKQAAAMGRLRAWAEHRSTKVAEEGTPSRTVVVTGSPTSMHTGLGALLGATAGAGLGALHGSSGAMLGANLGGLLGAAGGSHIGQRVQEQRMDAALQRYHRLQVARALAHAVEQHPEQSHGMLAEKQAAGGIGGLVGGALTLGKNFIARNPNVIGQAALGGLGSGISAAMSGEGVGGTLKAMGSGAAVGAITGTATDVGGRAIGAYQRAAPGTSLGTVLKGQYNAERSGLLRGTGLGVASAPTAANMQAKTQGMAASVPKAENFGGMQSSMSRIRAAAKPAMPTPVASGAPAAPNAAAAGIKRFRAGGAPAPAMNATPNANAGMGVPTNGASIS